MQNFTSEVAAAMPRNYAMLSTNKHASKLSSILLYQRPGELLMGVAVSRCVVCEAENKNGRGLTEDLASGRPNYIVIASEFGTR